ncbi:Acid phosphatase [Aphelenchoides fujianensis]|nr:Acid phosphatase [Aphelenchoides fujianensis]
MIPAILLLVWFVLSLPPISAGGRADEAGGEFQSINEFVRELKPPTLFRRKRLAPLTHGNDTKDELVFVQVLFRHGDRTPERPFWFDKPGQWRGLAELTPKGMAQMVELGKKLRTKYVDTMKLVDPHYNPNQVYFRSSDKNRTLMSAMATTVGFFGKGRRGIDFPVIEDWPGGFVPVPVHTVDWPTDLLFNQYVQCPRAERARQLLRDSVEYKLLERRTSHLFTYLSKIRNETITLENAYWLYDMWLVHRLYNASMPPEFTDDLWRQFEAVGFVMNDYQFGVGVQPFNGMDLRRELTRLRGGTILNEFVENMRQKVRCSEAQEGEWKDEKFAKACGWMRDLKFHAYSGHDTTIEVVFSAFGFETTNYVDVGEPKYAASVSFELWKRATDGEYVVKVHYWPPQMGTFDITADISGCGGADCSLERFAARSRPFTMSLDLQEECRIPTG